MSNKAIGTSICQLSGRVVTEEKPFDGILIGR